MPFFRPINLPPLLIIQSVTLTSLGVYLTLSGRSPFVYKKYSMLVPASPTPRTSEAIRVLGVVTAALEGAYLLSSYMPFEENQLIAVSIPVRLAISSVLGVIALWKRKEMTKAGFWEYMGLAVMDGLAALRLGFQFGRFDGMVVGAEQWL